MASINFDITDFRAKYPMFVSQSDSVVTNAFDMGTLYVDNSTTDTINEAILKQLLYLATAHILQFDINQTSSNGKSVGVVASSTADKLSVTYQQRNINNDFENFFNQTGYGQRLLALLNRFNSIIFVCTGS